MKIFVMLRVLIDDKIPKTIPQEMLLALPEWRRRTALAYRFDSDRWLCARAYELLCQGLREEFGITEVPEFAVGTNGKPYLPELEGVHFNISHCRDAVAVALSDMPIGCDVESIVEDLDEDVMRYCFSPDEIEGIQNATSPNLEFTRLWTIKEAIVKLTGEGLVDDLPRLLLRSDINRISIETTYYDHYVLTTAQYQK